MKIETIKSREEALGKANKLDIDTVQAQIKFLQGKVLTIIEASFTDKAQLKAVKSIINNEFSNQLMYVYQLGYPSVTMLTSDQSEVILDKKMLEE